MDNKYLLLPSDSLTNYNCIKNCQQHLKDVLFIIPSRPYHHYESTTLHGMINCYSHDSPMNLLPCWVMRCQKRTCTNLIPLPFQSVTEHAKPWQSTIKFNIAYAGSFHNSLTSHKLQNIHSSKSLHNENLAESSIFY